MNLPRRISPRHIIGVTALVVVGVLMALESISTNLGVTMLAAILGSFGLYEGRKRVGGGK